MGRGLSLSVGKFLPSAPRRLAAAPHPRFPVSCRAPACLFRGSRAPAPSGAPIKTAAACLSAAPACFCRSMFSAFPRPPPLFAFHVLRRPLPLSPSVLPRRFGSARSSVGCAVWSCFACAALAASVFVRSWQTCGLYSTFPRPPPHSARGCPRRSARLSHCRSAGLWNLFRARHAFSARLNRSPLVFQKDTIVRHD